MTTLGAKIRKIRELKNLKQEYMADRLGISITAYGKMERDETNIGAERLEQIANVLGMSPEDIQAFDERLIFNVMHNKDGTYNNNNGGTHYYQFPQELKQLYEDKIRLLEEMNDYLKKEIARLKSPK